MLRRAFITLELLRHLGWFITFVACWPAAWIWALLSNKTLPDEMRIVLMGPRTVMMMPAPKVAAAKR